MAEITATVRPTREEVVPSRKRGETSGLAGSCQTPPHPSAAGHHPWWNGS